MKPHETNSSVHDWHNSYDKHLINAELAQICGPLFLRMSSVAAHLLFEESDYIPFMQKRIGMYSAPFWLPKLQTLPAQDLPITNNHKNLPPLMEFVRTFAVDEFPQVSLVSTDPSNPGPMSFVSHRPQMPDELNHMESTLVRAGQGNRFWEWYDGVYCAKRPGVFSNESFLEYHMEPGSLEYYEERMELGHWYQEHGSREIDLKIMIGISGTAMAFLGVHQDPSK